MRDFIDAAIALTDTMKPTFPLAHPHHADLAFLHGTILTDVGNGQHEPTTNVCVFADAEVDRSQTGSGVTARLSAALTAGPVPFPGAGREGDRIRAGRGTAFPPVLANAGEPARTAPRPASRAAAFTA